MRSFTITSVKKLNGAKVNYEDGRYISENPSGAARKAFSKAYNFLNIKGPLSLKIEIRETTQGSLHKLYNYRITKKTEKIEVEKNGVIVTYNFTTKVKSI